MQIKVKLHSQTEVQTQKKITFFSLCMKKMCSGRHETLKGPEHSKPRIRRVACRPTDQKVTHFSWEVFTNILSYLEVWPDVSPVFHYPVSFQLQNQEAIEFKHVSVRVSVHIIYGLCAYEHYDIVEKCV